MSAQLDIFNDSGWDSPAAHRATPQEALPPTASHPEQTCEGCGKSAPDVLLGYCDDCWERIAG